MKSNPFEGLPQGTQTFVLIFVGIFVALFALIFVLYLKNLQDLLKAVRPENRKMAPGKVWLLLVNFLGLFTALPELMGWQASEGAVMAMTVLQYAISGFALAWTFYMVNKIADSVSAELESRDMAEPAKPTYAIGLFMCGCNTLGLAANIPYLADLALIAAGAGLVAWIMYWYKTNAYKNKLAALPPNPPFSF